ncbi:MAG: hypothetical protein KAJ63_06185 [Methyloprofundus sp.]|nr:hypothetical protein [Methyloprofundus sp.]
MKKLKGVAYDIAHHAQSGLSWIHPHIGGACKETGITEATIHLLSENPYPENLPIKKPLELAISSLQKKYEEIMLKTGLPLSSVKSFDIIVIFNSADNYTCSVRSILKTESGKIYDQIVH